jgi:hypothetical protein
MRSKMVSDRLKANDSVLEALRQLAGKVGAQMEALLAPYLKKGEKMPDLELFARMLERMLEDAGSKMDKADAAHNQELADDAEPRERRDAATSEVYSALVEVKGAIGTIHGAGWVAKLGIPAEVPRDPAVLARLAGDLSSALATAKFPKPRLRGVKSFDVAPWIAALDEPRKALEQALKDVTREAREAQATLVQKTRAVETYDAAFSTAVACAAGLLRLAGEPEHAAKLRPSDRRPGTLEAPAVPDGSEEEPDAEGDGSPQPG